MYVQKPERNYDVVVVGGGMVGASFACSIANAIGDADLSILVIEAIAVTQDNPQQPSFDARSTALSYGSSRIFESMGLWHQLAKVATPINEIHVSDKGRFGSAQLDRQEHNIDALGYVIENKKLGVVLNTAMEDSPLIHFYCPATITSIKPVQAGMSLMVDANHAIDASLVVLADGGKSPICQQLGITRSVESYKQHALIANIAYEKAHNNIAFERFTDTGPLAILPLEQIEGENRGSLVWTLSEQQSAEFAAMSEDDLISRLQERFGNRLGQIRHIGERFIYPLSLSVANEQIRPGLVLLGNVAHTIHPVAGQGLNLALRDTQALVTVLQNALAEGKPLGEMAVLQQYIQLQESDQSETIRLTHYITQLFSSNNSAKAWFRKFGLFSMDLIPSLRQEFSRRAMGIGAK